MHVALQEVNKILEKKMKIKNMKPIQDVVEVEECASRVLFGCNNL